jgi:hypothetical protein
MPDTMKLSLFIPENLGEIIAEWEHFAATLVPAGSTMSRGRDWSPGSGLSNTGTPTPEAALECIFEPYVERARYQRTRAARAPICCASSSSSSPDLTIASAAERTLAR